MKGDTKRLNVYSFFDVVATMGCNNEAKDKDGNELLLGREKYS